MIKKFVVAIFLILFLSLPVSATYDVFLGGLSNNTPFVVTSSSWVDVVGGNLTINSLSAGNSTILVNVEGRTNYTLSTVNASLKILVDGVEVKMSNISQQNYYASSSTLVMKEIAAGNHTYAIQMKVSGNKSFYVQKWDMIVLHAKNGTYGSGSGGNGNVSSITCSPVGILDCSGTDEVTVTLQKATSTTSGYLSSEDFNNKITNATAQINRSQVTGLSDMLNAMNASSAANNTASQSRDDVINVSKYNKSDLPTCNPTTQKGVPNGTGITCETDMTSSFSLNSITSAANIYGDGTVTVSTVGSNINLSAPGLTVTNISVDPYRVNASNLTGSINQSVIVDLPESKLDLNYPTHSQTHTLNGSDHTGSLDYNRVNNITINLTAANNLSGTLADVFILSAATWNAALRTASGVSPITVETVGTAITISCKVVNSTQAGCLSSADWTTFNNKLTNATAQINLSQVTSLPSILDGKADAVYSNTTFLNKSALNGTAQINISQVTGQSGVDTGQNSSISTLQVNDSYFNGSVFPLSKNFANSTITTLEVTPKSFMFNTSIVPNGTNITRLSLKFSGTVTDLNITSASTTGSANISLFKNNVYVANVNLTNGEYASTSGLSTAFTSDDTLIWKLDSGSRNFRITVTTVTRRS